MTNRNAAFSRSDRTFRTFPTFRLGNAAKSGASAPGFFRSLHEFKCFFRLTDDFSRRIFPQTQQIPVILRSRGFIWRRRRDLNSRADFSTYSLSRGAPSPAWVRLHVKLCSFRGLSSRLSQNKWRNGWDSFSAENPRRLQHAAGMLPRAAFRIPDSPSSINGGTGGIRTHAPFRTNGFQDRLVMTASIPLQTVMPLA